MKKEDYFKGQALQEQINTLYDVLALFKDKFQNPIISTTKPYSINVEIESQSLIDKIQNALEDIQNKLIGEFEKL